MPGTQTPTAASRPPAARGGRVQSDDLASDLGSGRVAPGLVDGDLLPGRDLPFPGEQRRGDLGPADVDGAAHRE